jgi:hypothetical protein
VETAIYNEREKLYDAFSNLFLDFQSLSRSDIDGSKTSKFWQNDLLAFLAKVCFSFVLDQNISTISCV